MGKIFSVTRVIQKKFPELYIHLNETPMYMATYADELQIAKIEFKKYLFTLKNLLTTFEDAANRKPLKTKKKDNVLPTLKAQKHKASKS